MAVVPSVAAAPSIATCAAVRSAIGEDAWAQTLARLPKEVQEELSATAPVGWVRVSSLRAMFEAASAVSGRDADLLTDEAVRVSTAQTFRTIWRVLLPFVTAEAIVKRASALYGKSRNVGAMSVRSVGDHRAELELSQWPRIQERDLRSLAVATRSILEVAGRRDVQCRWSLAEDGGVITLTWR